MEELKKQIDPKRVPTHVAVIMDGNGRWAKQKGQERVFGHSNGIESVRNTLTAATEAGVKYLTLYAFSAENWNRPKEEVEALMNLLVQTIFNEVEELHKNGVRLNAIGDLDSLPSLCKEALDKAMDYTKDNSTITLTLALSYSSQKELLQATQKLAKDVASGKIKPEKITESHIQSSLYTADMPNPDLLIRTSGEERISNFLLWQLAYAELYFTDTFWPDFNSEEFFKAIINYQNRERRFGKISEQIGANPNEA